MRGLTQDPTPTSRGTSVRRARVRTFENCTVLKALTGLRPSRSRKPRLAPTRGFGSTVRVHVVFHSLVHGREMSVSLNMANQNAINIIFNFVFIQDHLRATTKTKSNHLLLLLSRISLNQLTLIAPPARPLPKNPPPDLGQPCR